VTAMLDERFGELSLVYFVLCSAQSVVSLDRFQIFVHTMISAKPFSLARVTCQHVEL
jgi:hypothetical protein